jgi:hypothetical protein
MLKVKNREQQAQGEDMVQTGEQALGAAGKIRERQPLTAYDLFMTGLLSFVAGIFFGYAWKFLQG